MALSSAHSDNPWRALERDDEVALCRLTSLMREYDHSYLDKMSADVAQRIRRGKRLLSTVWLTD